MMIAISKALDALIVCPVYLLIYLFVGLVHDGTGNHNLVPIKFVKERDLNAISNTLDRCDERYWRFGSIIQILLGLYLDDDLRWNFPSKVRINR
jgi:hypothetical protein